MKPEADKLGTFVVKHMMKKGIVPNKINLAACKSAGGKVHQGTFELSNATKFCKALLATAGTEQVALAEPLAVCAYNVDITTYDPVAPIFQHKYRDVPRGPGLDTKPVRSAVMTYSGHLLTNLEQTHPVLEGSVAQALTTSLTNIRAEAEAFAWGKVKSSIKGAKDYGSLADAKGAGVDVSENQLKQYETKMSQEISRLLKSLTGDHPELRVAIETYIKNKVVLVYSATNQTFSVGSVANYTNNTLLRDLVTVVESTSLRADCPRVKLTFNA
jgi:hypothetical protein